MKKIYMMPSITTTEIHLETLLTGSNEQITEQGGNVTPGNTEMEDNDMASKGGGHYIWDDED